MRFPATRIALFIIGAVMALCSVVCAPRAAASGPQRAPRWEVVTSADGGEALRADYGNDGGAPRLEVAVREGYIYISVDSRMKVEVFTILGQLVTSRTVAPGTVRLALGSRGIYIIKGAGTTRRVNL